MFLLLLLLILSFSFNDCHLWLLGLLPGKCKGPGFTLLPGGPIVKRCIASISGSRSLSLTAGRVTLLPFLLYSLFLLLGSTFLLGACGTCLCGVPCKAGQPSAWLLGRFHGKHTGPGFTLLPGGPIVKRCIGLISESRSLFLAAGRVTLLPFLLCSLFLLLLGSTFLFGACGTRLCGVPCKGGQPSAWLWGLLPGKCTGPGFTLVPCASTVDRCMLSVKEARSLLRTAGGVTVFLLLH